MRSFDINGRTFDARRIDTAVELGTIVEWELVNTGQMDHPFHVHTNLFQLVGSDGLVEIAWRDVVNMPRGGRQRIRSLFAALHLQGGLPLPYPRSRRPWHDGHTGDSQLVFAIHLNG